MRTLYSLLLAFGIVAASPALAKPEAPEAFPPAAPDKPAPDDADAEPASTSPGAQLESWLSRLAPSGFPDWAWGLGGLAGLLLLRRLFRRAERDDDLMGPPRPARYRDLPRY